MSQLWDFPEPDEDPNNIWKDLKAVVLPEHKQDTPNDIWVNLKVAILSKPDNKAYEDSNKASIPEIKVTPSSPPLRPSVECPSPIPIQHRDQLELKPTLQVPLLSYKNPESKSRRQSKRKEKKYRNRKSKKARSAGEAAPGGKGSGKKDKNDTQLEGPIPLMPTVKVVPPTLESKDVQSSGEDGDGDVQARQLDKPSVAATEITSSTPNSRQARSSKEGENGDAQAEGSDALIPEIEVIGTTPDAKLAPTSDENGAIDAQEELDTPSISRDKGKQREVEYEEKNAHVSNIPVIDGFGSSDVADFLSLGDNGQVRKKLEAILREDEPKTIQSAKVEDDGDKPKKQEFWAAEIRAALKSGSILKRPGDDENGSSRELSRIRTELDAISWQSEPKTVACTKSGEKAAQPMKQGSWAAEVRALLKSGSVSKPVQEGGKVGDNNHSKEPKSEVISETKKPKSAQAKKSNSSWAAEVKASFEPAPILKCATSSEVVESSNSQRDENTKPYKSSKEKKPESTQAKMSNSYWAVEANTALALGSVMKFLPYSEVGDDELIENPIPFPPSEAKNPGDSQAKKPNWFSRSQGVTFSTGGPNATISWDFWADQEYDSPKSKEVCHMGHDSLAYPMPRTAADG